MTNKRKQLKLEELKNRLITVLLLFVNLCFSQSKMNQTEFKQIVSKYESDYSNESIKSLNIKSNDKTFLIRYIGEEAYIALIKNGKKLMDWQRIVINFTYDSSYEFAEKKIKIFYNQEQSVGYIVTPSFTEGLPRFNLYHLSLKGMEDLGEYYIPETKEMFGIGSFEGYNLNILNTGSTIQLVYIKNKSVIPLEKDTAPVSVNEKKIPLKQLTDSEKI
ncbi:hypothetical protein ACFO7M_03905 [Flavobacterium sp. GCM10023249]